MDICTEGSIAEHYNSRVGHNMLSETSSSYYNAFHFSGENTREAAAESIAEDAIGIVIVNWNSWGETLESLEAISKLSGFSGPVVVCDNASHDDSVANIEQWVLGNLCALPESRDPEILELTRPSSEPITSYVTVNHGEIEQQQYRVPDKVQLYIVKNEDNLGFGAGSNIGIRLLQANTNVEWYWLLNCDALPARDAFQELRGGLPRHSRPAICGTTLLEYSDPKSVQSCGAEFNRLLCSMNDRFRGVPLQFLDTLTDTLRVDYPVGASTLVNRAFIAEVGLLGEDYFLYFEELDWVMRHAWPSQAFIIVRSIVYHKGGSTTGAGASYKERTLSADYFFLRSRVLFARRYGLLGVLTGAIVSLVALWRRALLFDRKALVNAIDALRAGFKMRV